MARGVNVFLCGTPGDTCFGTLGILSAGFKGKSIRTHGSPQEAFRCHKRYLISVKGFLTTDTEGQPLKANELRAPDGSGYRMLTKPSRFGAKLRPGKEGARNMPSRPRTGGTCTSC